MNCQRKAGNKYFRRAAVGVMAAFSILWLAMGQADRNPVYRPDYERIPLEVLFEDIRAAGAFGKEAPERTAADGVDEEGRATSMSEVEGGPQLTESEYKEIFRQTGLGKPAVDYLMAQENYEEEIAGFQEIFFDGYPYTCAKIGLFTYNERLRDAKGKSIKGRWLVDMEPGDVLVSLSTHTMGYRHGHCAMVVSKADRGKEAKTIEATYLGTPTAYRTTGKWRSYPTLIHLRISEEAAASKGYTQAELGQAMADYATANCLGVDYGILPELSGGEGEPLQRTHCSHLIWYIMKQFGYDVDSNGGLVVTPEDVARSNLFEIVQIYGIEPDWQTGLDTKEDEENDEDTSGSFRRYTGRR